MYDRVERALANPDVVTVCSLDRMFSVRLFAIVLLLFSAHLALAQRHTPAPKRPPVLKTDMMMLRYKPQAGTLLYDIRTRIEQHVRTDRDELSGDLVSTAQLAFHNVLIDYKAGLWVFDQYFTKFQIAGHELNGDTLSLNEHRAVNKLARLTYDMQGFEYDKNVIDSLKLLNAEAQTNSYFFQPPRLLTPLPPNAVTYGATWTDHRQDTVQVLDTINIGTTTGQYVYDVNRTYRFDRLIDTLETFFALIVAVDSGTFDGYQTNTVTNVTTKTHGPITGADTTYLDLFSGRVVRRTLRMAIPAIVEISSATPFTDFIEVRSVVTLNESNATKWWQEK